MLLNRVGHTAAWVLLWGTAAAAQVMTPSDLKDPSSQRLQQQYMPQLKAAGERVADLQFPYHFYLSRTLDVSEREEQTLPHASIRFDKLDRRAVLAITGNYYASYSTKLLNSNQRARQTFQDVLLPL
ncbi:MAG: hypothetical protein JO041_05235, partial [Acidobacteria bacterium]|nr:hypothetical protein [Acidobacteriota bacterium]